MPETRERRWNKAFGHLVAYVQAEGDARVPFDHRTADDYPLGRWVAHQRTKKDSLSADRRERLDGVGFVWDGQAAKWDEGFGHLLAYVQAEGHARVPQSHQTADGYPLGQWVTTQRSRKDSLSADRRQRLDEVEGWVWGGQAAAWDKAFGHLVAYIEAEGHARVPLRHRTDDGYRLGQWVNHQRSGKDTLSKERRQRLVGVGFVWDERAAYWEEGFGYLLVYVQAEGHARVPESHQTADGFLLGVWVGNQRRVKDTLSEDRRQRLDGVGFVWDPLAADWEEGFRQLLAYVEAEGHVLVPQIHRTADDYRLGRWVNVQRFKKDTLSPERRQRLDAVGFIWYAKLRHVAIQSILGNYRQMKGNDSD